MFELFEERLCRSNRLRDTDGRQLLLRIADRDDGIALS